MDKNINNKKYVLFIISFEEYLMARGEKNYAVVMIGSYSCEI